MDESRKETRGAWQKTEGEREQIKLQAGYLNGIAIGLFLVGGLSIPTSILLNAAAEGSVAGAIVVSIFCFAASPTIHWAARRSLGELDR